MTVESEPTATSATVEENYHNIEYSIRNTARTPSDHDVIADTSSPLTQKGCFRGARPQHQRAARPRCRSPPYLDIAS